METTNQLALRLEEIILNGTWVANTNYKDQLENLDLKTATTQIGSLHTIADLAQHIHYYLKGVLKVFQGGPLEIRDKFSFDFPPMGSQDEWESFLSDFWQQTEQLVTSIAQLPEEKLSDVFVDHKYGTYERNINGMIEHGYYHLGQIVLIKKLISQGM